MSYGVVNRDKVGNFGRLDDQNRTIVATKVYPSGRRARHSL